MSSQWTNKYAIMRDLSLAQGFEVPVDLSDTVAAGDKPPALNIPEETEEEFYNNGLEEGDGNAGPDLILIQQMLKMIHPVSSDSEDETSVIQITKPAQSNKQDTEDTVRKVESDSTKPPPSNINKKKEMVIPLTTNKKKETVKKTKKKKRVNVALDSILQGLLEIKPTSDSKTIPKEESAPMKLLKPTDFMLKEEQKEETEANKNPLLNLQSNDSAKETDPVDKVNDWLSQNFKPSPMTNSVIKVNGCLDTNKSNSLEQKNKLFHLEPSSMFRKKNVVTKSVESDSIKSSPIQKDETKATTTFQPSAMADEYYKKFLERSKVKEIVREDVWTKAEKIMKEIDAKKSKEAEEAAQLQELASEEIVTSCDEIRLPQHRHLLTGECIVCEIVKKNGIQIDLKVLQNTEYDTAWLSVASKLTAWRKNT